MKTAVLVDDNPYQFSRNGRGKWVYDEDGREKRRETTQRLKLLHQQQYQRLHGYINDTIHLRATSFVYLERTQNTISLGKQKEDILESSSWKEEVR